jgi:hypothetical protein
MLHVGLRHKADQLKLALRRRQFTQMRRPTGLSAGFEVPLSTAGRERLNRADDSFRVRWI